MESRLRWAAGLFAIALAATSLAWNNTAHMVIATIAQAQLTPTAKAEADRLLKIGGVEGDFILQSTWADEEKNERSAAWHYINQHFRSDGGRTANKPAPENVVMAIDYFSKVLGDKSQSDANRALALRYLLHLVGDIHQPLHAVARDSAEHPRGDRGGNDFRVGPVSGLSGDDRIPTNLHELWDIGCGRFPYVPRLRGEDGQAWVRKEAKYILETLPRKSFSNLDETKPSAWAEESLEPARRVVYNLREGAAPGSEYISAGKGLSAKQVALAGYRLGDLLNRLLK